MSTEIPAPENAAFAHLHRALGLHDAVIVMQINRTFYERNDALKALYTMGIQQLLAERNQAIETFIGFWKYNPDAKSTEKP